MSVLPSLGDLTQLYTEAKKSALSNVTRTEPEEPQALSDLHRKFRIQKDRLIAWGLEWSDEGKGEDGNIDASVARAGLTDIVSSVLNSIKDTLEAAERIRFASLPVRSHQVWPSATVNIPEKPRWLAVDQSTYRDLVSDLTASIDTLYDLSRARRAIAQGSHPSFSNTDADEKPIISSKPASIHSFASSTMTLVNPSFSRPHLSPYVGLPPAIDQSALILPEEGPPPYESVGAPSTVRMIARLLLSQMPQGLRTCSQTSAEDPLVLVEFANYDMLYHETRVPPPLLRLESIFAFSQRPQQTSSHLRMLGYFDDSQSPRIGVVYELPANQAQILGPSLDFEVASPKSLLLLLQDASKSTKTVENVTATPPLEVRFRLALRISERLREMHIADIPHGNMNSSSIVFMTSNPKSRLPSAQLEAPLLDSFDIFSGTVEESNNRPRPLNIYQHPQGRVEKRSSSQAMKHDIYGLALTLLEIGLWVPLGDLYKTKYTLQDLKTRLEKIWIPKLASKCGSAYMRTVQKCFAFADSHDSSPQSEQLFHELVRLLNRCCCIDEEEAIDHQSDELTESMQVSAPAKRQRPRPTARASDPQTLSSRTSLEEPHSVHSKIPLTAPLHRLASLPNMTSGVPYMMANVPPRKAVPIRKPSQSSSTHVADSHRMDTIREGPTSAAISMRQAWDSRREQTALSFREIRRKVILLQKCWRQRREHLSREPPSNTALPLSDSATRRSICRKPSCKMFPVNLPPQVLHQWHSQLGMGLARIVERALKDSFESSTIDLVSMGPDELNARPTILITCASTDRVKAALKRKFHYDRDLFDVKVRKGRVSLSRGHSRKSTTQQPCRRSNGHGRDQDESDGEGDPPKNPYYQKRPVCGASIGAYLPDEGHLLPVSFGGIIHVDDKPYGMTVHHMLEPLSDDEADDEEEESAESGASDDESEAESIRSASEGNSVCESDNNSSRFRARRSSAKQPVNKSLPSRYRHASAGASSSHSINEGDESSSDLDAFEGNDEAYISSDFESDVSDDESFAESPISQISTTGDTPGYPVDSARTVQITQPALIDAVSTGWHLTNIDQTSQDSDHLLSFALGKVHASSGLRRTRHANLIHEIDWALLELHPPRLQPHNLVLGGRRHCTVKSTLCPALESPVLRSPISDARESFSFPIEQDLYPCSILPISALPNTPVLSFGRTSGLSTGRISAAMSFVKMAGRATFSHSWSVVGDFGVGGDSGAWVVDAEQGRVAGHVLAEQRGLTYFCPMEVLVDDIQATLGADRVRLPGDEEGEVITGLAEQDVVEAVEVGLQKADSAVSTMENAERTRGQKDSPVKTVGSKVREYRQSSGYTVV